MAAGPSGDQGVVLRGEGREDMSDDEAGSQVSDERGTGILGGGRSW